MSLENRLNSLIIRGVTYFLISSLYLSSFGAYAIAQDTEESNDKSKSKKSGEIFHKKYPSVEDYLREKIIELRGSNRLEEAEDQSRLLEGIIQLKKEYNIGTEENEAPLEKKATILNRTYNLVTNPFRKENRLPWDTWEKALLTPYILANIADGSQTVHMPDNVEEANPLIYKWWGTKHPNYEQVILSKLIINTSELWFWGDKVPFWADKYLGLDGHKTRKTILVGLGLLYTGAVLHNHKTMGFYFNHSF